METQSTVTSKGQVTIPQSVRERLDIKTGDRLIWYVDGERLVARKPKRLLDYRGWLGKALPQEEEERLMMKGIAEDEGFDA